MKMPKKFEKEVLKKHRIYLNNNQYKRGFRVINKYEIAAIALEDITNSIPYGLFGISEMINNGEGCFIDCVFKAIKQNYKD